MRSSSRLYVLDVAAGKVPASLPRRQAVAVVGGGWTKLVDLPLTSLSDWSAGAGAWTAEADRIRQAATTSTAMGLHYGTVVPVAQCVAECEIRIDSSVSTISSRAGFIFGAPRAVDGAGGFLIALAAGAAGQTTAVHSEMDSQVKVPTAP